MGDSKLSFTMHNDPDWRLCNDAKDEWIGEVSNEGADLIADFTYCASVFGWEEARKWAQILVSASRRPVSE